ncbi:hypothetical protein STSP2_02198 [Anaerohalosphaera lusitana]|uniref:Sulfotransferase family protein n=1 Tax=Anaerohalosphaera lusitana TaxID=1936003 RepID=A0A1U9NN36_9BACT|nr:sulfotransferase family protein [Anaerohalosphaera lusitana]AQT69020.1 hypothetical protein STSP2_02198 [Anaerohalosphaera lusitana]
MPENDEFITIVSGLPRSGTSMMMQALEAGGIPILTDHIRSADVDNPRGYYEFEAVKKTKEDPSWLQQAPGKAVKMIYRLLYDLPEDRNYHVIFMDRPLEEVIASQKKMLERLGKKGGGIPDEAMIKAFEKELAAFDSWISTKKNFSVLHIEHRKMIEQPLEQCRLIADFLDGRVDPQKMAEVVDPTLHRNVKQ